MTGRYVRPDGSLTARPAGAVGVLLSGGRVIALPGVSRVGGHTVAAHGAFMDYDGQPQAAADVLTRGMIVFDAGGCATERDYVSVFDALAETAGPVTGEPAGVVAQACGHPDGTQDE